MKRSPRIGLNHATMALQNASILAPRAEERHRAALAKKSTELCSALSYAPHFGLKDAASALPFPTLLLSLTTAHSASRTQQGRHTTWQLSRTRRRQQPVDPPAGALQEDAKHHPTPPARCPPGSNWHTTPQTRNAAAAATTTGAAATATATATAGVGGVGGAHP